MLLLCGQHLGIWLLPALGLGCRLCWTQLQPPFWWGNGGTFGCQGSIQAELGALTSFASSVQGDTPKHRAEKANDPDLAAYLENRQHYQMIQREDQETAV